MEARMVARKPIGWLGPPEEVAETVVWLCSDAVFFVTGYTMTVEGGLMAHEEVGSFICERFTDRLIAVVGIPPDWQSLPVHPRGRSLPNLGCTVQPSP